MKQITKNALSLTVLAASCFTAVAQDPKPMTGAQITAAAGDTIPDAGPLATDISGALNRTEIQKAMRKVADWQLSYSEGKYNQDWTYGPLYLAFLQTSDITGDAKYHDRVVKAFDQFDWKLWANRPFHADDEVIAQSYEILYQEKADPKRIADAKATFDRLVATPSDPKKDLWWWCDALFMAPPALVRMSVITGDHKYIDKMDHEWDLTTQHLYDPAEKLYFRDASYLDKKEKNGQKLFWSRGNGWVVAGLANVLKVLPKKDPLYPKYLKLYKDMAERVAGLQQPDGLWRTGLLDQTSYEAGEISGTGFYTYALTWGINEGILPKAKFGPVVEKAWPAMVKHVFASGRLGSIQPIGGAPGAFTPTSSFVYGVGAFLSTGSELVRYVGPAKKKAMLKVANPTTIARRDEVLDLPLAQVKSRFSEPAAIVARDHATAKRLLTQVYSSKPGGPADRFLILEDVQPGNTTAVELSLEEGVPQMASRVDARDVPERADDFVWENDKVAFRVYGPALQATGEITSGIDVWSKRVPLFVNRIWYAQEKQGRSYHKDYGQGQDSYEVAASRGCGGSGVWVDGKLVNSKNVLKAHVYTMGPIRLDLTLDYEPWQAGGKTVTESKRITLDAGSRFNHIRSTYRFEGTAPITIGAGLGTHKGTEVKQLPQSGAISLWDTPQSADAGRIATGLIRKGTGYRFQEVPMQGKVPGDALLLFDVRSGGNTDYYAGAGWSKDDMPDFSTWNDFVTAESKRLKTPVTISWSASIK